MTAYGIEICDAGFRAAILKDGQVETASPEKGGSGPLDWMGFAYHDGVRFVFGRPAEDQWFVYPRQVSHEFWGRLSREPSTLGFDGGAAHFSQIAFHFLKDFLSRVKVDPPEKIMLAVPGAYLKDAATEEERIGLLLGMARELDLPLAGIVDTAVAAFSDPRVDYFDPALPVMLVDVHLHGCEIALLRQGADLERADALFLPHGGYAELLRHLTVTMGNRFLRQTGFDINEDGKIEQAFYGQMKSFMAGGAAEQVFQINTARRTYELPAIRDQLIADTASFLQSLLHGVQSLMAKSGVSSGPCTIALTDRTALVPGVAAGFHAAGFLRLLRLPGGAAAAGAARLAEEREPISDIAEVPVITNCPAPKDAGSRQIPWDVHLVKGRPGGTVLVPTHVICEGLGHAFDGHSAFSIGVATARPDLRLPVEFDVAGENCVIRLERDSGRWWLLEAGLTRAPVRSAIESGDRLVVSCGDARTEILFARCLARGEQPPGRR